ncbi:restriction endonuclease subunit S [Bradyrhizobium sediminis]|uniref:Restriction endonuclease subunit S n=1 Tax=Bradyrhizobium sediminis TaxID=2840469 RepID=A0A975RS88_9BRAD|nr:restriction endonuclease subunit S [Bradyrhizobium sediminis]QWG18717.1 restriction endonuclease subunit S [Bradyrhizobium sediminis]
MSQANGVERRGFAVWWADLDRWSVNSLRTTVWHWPREVVRPLSEAIERSVEPVDKRQFELRPEHFISIRFSGEIEPRDLHGKSEFKGALFFASPGDIVYSKIDVRNGAIGIVPETVVRAVVTSEFPVYHIKENVALRDYVQIVFRTSTFRSIINRMVSGASGRKRVQPEDLENVPIPLPSKSEQEKIVAFWREAQGALMEARGRLDSIVASLNQQLWSIYQTATSVDMLAQRSFSLEWKDMDQWDGKSARAVAYRLACPNFTPLSEIAEEISDLVRPWEDPDKEWPVFGVNNTEGVFFSHNQKGSDFNAPYKRIRKNWFFHNPTRANVGSLGVVSDVPDDALTSPEYQVWRLTDETPVGYIATLINTQFFLKLVDVHRVGGVKQRLYAESLLRIVVPPVSRSIQEEIAKARSSALVSIKEAKLRLLEAESELEKIVLGIKSI